MGPNTRVHVVYWPLAALRGLLVRVRTALAELIAELVASTPAAQEVPDSAAVDQAVSLVVTGERATVVINPQQTIGESASSVSSTYHGPVFQGSVDGAQLAWNNQSVIQNHNRVQQVAPGYEALAEAMTDVLRQLPTMAPWAASRVRAHRHRRVLIAGFASRREWVSPPGSVAVGQAAVVAT